MQRANGNEYHGSFTPKKPGRYIVYSRMTTFNPDVGYPEPIRVRVRR